MIHFSKDELEYLESVVLFSQESGEVNAEATKDDYVNLTSNVLWRMFVSDVNSAIRLTFAKLLSTNPSDSVEIAACQEKLKTLLDVRSWIVRKAIYDSKTERK